MRPNLSDLIAEVIVATVYGVAVGASALGLLAAVVVIGLAVAP